MMRWLQFAARLALGGVFIYAGGLKIVDPAAFAQDIANYRLLPVSLVNLAAITLPWVEVLAGALLVCGYWRRASALVIAVLAAVFIVAISQALARGLDIRCGCFGTLSGRQAGIKTLALDTVMLAVACWLVYWRQPDET